MPVAITFDKGESTREKLPPDIYEDVIDTQKYVYAHVMSCYEQAAEYGDVDTGQDWYDANESEHKSQ